MFHLKFMIVYLIGIVNGQDLYFFSNFLDFDETQTNLHESDVYLMADKIIEYKDEKVNVQVYYESLCPDCREFDSKVLAPTVKKLHQYLNIYVYPYGNAKTIEKDGKYEFICQHGPEECYGNKLHACAIDVIQNITTAIVFNSCMMSANQTGRGSNDAAADVCGTLLQINSLPIKNCANGERGNELLKEYGDASKIANFKYVPYILVNSKESTTDDFVQNICKQFVNPPPPCVNK